MNNKEKIRNKYLELSRMDKEIVGTALVKVNLGVGMPGDLRMIADFLRGSPYIAKKGTLDALIHYLHADHTDTKTDPPANLPPDRLTELNVFDEDHEITAKEKIPKR